MERSARPYVRSTGGEIPTVGRGRAWLFHALPETSWLDYFHSAVSPNMPNAVAREIDVDRVSLPVQAGRVRPVDVLSSAPRPGSAQVCRDLRRLEGPLAAWPNPTLRPCQRIAPDAETQLARKLIECDMACLIDESDIPAGPDGKVLVGGWFAVQHIRCRHRFIFDRRPENSTETLLNSWIDLPSGTQLIHLIVDPRYCARGPGEDLECYFYQLLVF